jgi:hypothetical protein
MTLALAILFACACEPSPEEAQKAFHITANPGTFSVGPGETLKLTVDNKSGKAVQYQWEAKEDCGELSFGPDASKAFEAVYKGRAHDQICSTNLVLTVLGAHKQPLVFEHKVTVRPQEKAREAELRPSPLPESWQMINDFNGSLTPKVFECVRKSRAGDEEVSEEVKLNRLGANFTDWSFESSTCTIYEEQDQGETVMALGYDIATDDSYCGYMENLKLGKDCDTKLFDLSPFETLTFLAKSGDDHDHQLLVEIIQWEKYAEFHQGRAAQFGPITVGREWKRHEVPIAKVCKKDVDPTFVKSVGLKVTRMGSSDKGIILIDNMALIRKPSN